MMCLLLARHAATAHNAQWRYQGWSDEALSAAGEAQARQLTAALAAEAVDAIYTSDLERARLMFVLRI